VEAEPQPPKPQASPRRPALGNYLPGEAVFLCLSYELGLPRECELAADLGIGVEHADLLLLS
jgi:hypothetical protein